jgi:hypothetical protein
MQEREKVAVKPAPVKKKFNRGNNVFKTVTRTEREEATAN